MMALRPFRWFLGLLASFLATLAPVAATTYPASETSEDPTIQRPGDTHVVFRHYL